MASFFFLWSRTLSSFNEKNLLERLAAPSVTLLLVFTSSVAAAIRLLRGRESLIMNTTTTQCNPSIFVVFRLQWTTEILPQITLWWVFDASDSEATQSAQYNLRNTTTLAPRGEIQSSIIAQTTAHYYQTIRFIITTKVVQKSYRFGSIIFPAMRSLNAITLSPSPPPPGENGWETVVSSFILTIIPKDFFIRINCPKKKI